MHYQSRREHTLLDIQHTPATEHLTTQEQTDYLVVGGGIAGLHTALELRQKMPDARIILIEQSICGAGMSGRSGGFLTPDSELGLRQIQDVYGAQRGQDIWSFGAKGQTLIVDTARMLGQDVDLRQDDSLVLGIGRSGSRAIATEHQERIEAGRDSTRYDQKSLTTHCSGIAYTSGLTYTDTYGINPMQYCQALKSYLLEHQVQIYENTTLKQIHHNHILTNGGRIDFDHVIYAMGKVSTDIDPVRSANTFGIQNYISVSEPLTDLQIKTMFPDGKTYMCRDTQTVFTYYRLIGEGRLLIGGGTPLSAFFPYDVLYDQVIQGVIKDVRRTYPILKQVQFPYYRSGRIQVTRDLMPMIGPDTQYPHHIWLQGATGLPWAAASGRYAAQRSMGSDDIDPSLKAIFDPHRSFLIPRTTNNPILQSVIFALCNGKVTGLL